MFRNKEWRHKWLKKKSVSLVEINISIEEKARFFSTKKRLNNGTFF